MPRYWAEIRNLGQYGIVKDGDSLTVPLNTWDEATNAWFSTKGVGVLVGDRDLAMSPNTHLTFRLGFSVIYGPGYFFGSSQRMYLLNGFGNLVDVTRSVGGNYGGGDWRFDVSTNGNAGGIIAANGVDVPQYWNGVTMENIPAWPGGAPSIITPYKNFLVTATANKVHWSHSIPSGSSLPTSWSVSTPSEDGGEQYLQTYDIREMADLGDSKMIYGADGVWEMKYIGYPFVFSFNRIFPSLRILYKRCVCRFVDGIEKHFVLSGNNCYVHDGRQITPILTEELRRYFFEQVFSAVQGTFAYVVPRHMENEIWVMMKSNGTYPTTALIWNWATKNWTLRSAPVNTQYIDGWYYDARPDSIHFLTTNDTFTQRGFVNVNARKYAAPDVKTLTLVLEKCGLSPVKTQSGQVINDPSRQKTLHSLRLWTQDIGAGNTITVQLGASMGSPQNIVYTYSNTFTPYSGQQHETLTNINLEGRWFGIKITVTPNAAVSTINQGLLLGYDMELTEGGLF